MRTIQTRLLVKPGGEGTVRIPPDVPPGEHQAVLVIEEKQGDLVRRALPDFPVDDYGPWPENLSLRREDEYDDSAR